jgi:hypothetical protein
MYEQSGHPCEALLRKWQEKREIANYYFTAMLRLSPDDDNAYQRRRELSAKLFQARIALKHADDQLQSCYQEFSRGSLGQH